MDLFYILADSVMSLQPKNVFIFNNTIRYLLHIDKNKQVTWRTNIFSEKVAAHN